MNVNDSELVAAILEDTGFKMTTNIDKADIILFNSCSVRQHAEDRVVGRITQEGSRKNASNLPLIGLLGCVAQKNGNKLLTEIQALDFVVGTDQYKKLPEIILSAFQNKIRKAFIEQDNSVIYEDIKPVRKKGTNAFVTIMRGCNNFCTYCIVPYVRGRERSRNINKILKEIKEAGEAEYKDITLLGQNVNSYKFKEYDFADLLKKAAQIDNIKRLRFVTSHPKDLSDEVIKTMASEKKICESLHLPLQSASNEILGRMNRKYTYEHYLEIINKLRDAMPDIAITTDVLVGFPGESEEDFLKTYNALKSIEFDYSFTFKYSPRQGTKAAEFDDQVDEKVRLRRLKKLIDLQNDITAKKYKEKIGNIESVYVEQISKKCDKELSGRTKDNKIAVFPGKKKLIGSFADIKIVDAIGWTLIGEKFKS